MEVPAGFLLVSLLVSCFVATSHGVYFSSLKKTLTVTASPTTGQVMKAGEDKITLTWGFDHTFPAGTDSAYKTIKVKLCYAPISQKDRSWRKTVDLLKKDKTCPHNIVARPYAALNNSFTWIVKRDIPSAVYFMRAFALDAQEVQVATYPLISHPSAFLHSQLSLAGFFYMEKRKAKASQKK
ncbi:hypothetical protein R6Q57_000356 [Mikania cordata]